MTASNVPPWLATPGRLSEGPRWHEKREELLSVDILAGHIRLQQRGRRPPWLAAAGGDAGLVADGVSRWLARPG
jgi:sugar lactone lactonase YvrE